MSEARTEILARLRVAPRLPDTPPAPLPPVRERSAEECLARFVAELAALGVETHVEEAAEDVRRRIASLVEGKRVLSWDRLPYDARVEGATLGRDPRERQAEAEIGLTGCDAAIAETGSLALFSGPGKSRAVSLLPFTHVAIVRRQDLCFGMGEFFRRHPMEAAGCNIITGPSRTADIELSLTLGFHGPGRVVVVIGP